MFKKGDFIEHPRKEWGYGLVMEDQVGDLLKINFRGIGIKKISLKYTTIKIAKCPGDSKNKTFDSIIKKRFYIHESFREIYQDLKSQYNNYLVIIENGIYYEVLYKDAASMSEIYGWKVYERSNGQPITGFKNTMSYIFQDLQKRNIPYVLVKQATHKSKNKTERKVSLVFHGKKAISEDDIQLIQKNKKA